jgi:hypothetical protein
MRRHLTSDLLVDLAEGVRSDASLPHLQSCEACRAKLAELRGVLSTAAEMDVPEPSPLFWEHFSARVREAVEADHAQRTPRFRDWLSWPAVPLWAGSVAIVLLAVVVMMRGSVSEAPAPSRLPGAVAEAAPDLPGPAEDASLSLVADLVTGLDWDAAVEAGLSSELGIADRVVMQLSDDERRELQQLLRMELGKKVQSTKHKSKLL